MWKFLIMSLSLLLVQSTLASEIGLDDGEGEEWIARISKVSNLQK
jgi:hypothetical protein